MKNISKERIKDIVIFLLVGILGGIIIFNFIHTFNGKAVKETPVAYRPADETLYENGFYPGRVYGDYTDLTFCFNDYLKSIGATEIQRYMYTTSEGKVYELRFKLNEFDYKITTTEFKSDLYTYGLYSRMEADDGKVIFAVPSENSGTYVSDATSPFKVDWTIFDVFHAATDVDCGIAKELRVGLEETNCPFYGLGIAHYEKWNDGTVTWHDDVGNFTFEEGLDLHY